MFITHYTKFDTKVTYSHSENLQEWESVMCNLKRKGIIQEFIINDIKCPEFIKVNNYVIGYDLSYLNMFGSKRFALIDSKEVHLYNQLKLYHPNIVLYNLRKLKRYQKAFQ